MGMAGPTLTDYLISFFTHIDIIDALSWLLFTQSTFRFVGAIVAGAVVDRSVMRVLISLLTINATGFIFPFTQSLFRFVGASFQT